MVLLLLDFLRACQKKQMTGEISGPEDSDQGEPEFSRPLQMRMNVEPTAPRASSGFARKGPNRM